jgi:hypothetical protein
MIQIVNKITIIFIDQACGVDIGVEDYPYIYFPTPD